MPRNGDQEALPACPEVLDPVPLLGGHAAEATGLGLGELRGFFGAFAMVCLSWMGPARPGPPGGPVGGVGSVEARVGCGDDGMPAFLVAALEGGFLDRLLVGEDADPRTDRASPRR